MKMTTTSTTTTMAYWHSRINKLSVGRSVVIPQYGRVTCYKSANGTYGSRKFKLSQMKSSRGRGNLSISAVMTDLSKHM